MMMMMIMTRCDLTFAEKLDRGQLNLAHSIKVKTDVPQKRKNSWSLWSQSGEWKGRKPLRKKLMEERNFEPGVEGATTVIMTVVMKEMTN